MLLAGSLLCWSQITAYKGLYVGDSISGSYIILIDSITMSATDTAMWSFGHKIELGASAGGGGGGGGTYNSGSGITIDGSNNIDFLGALDAPAIITGTEVNYLEIKMSDAGDRSVKLVFRPADALSIRAYSGDDYTGDSSEVRVDSNLVKIAVYDAGAEKSVKIDTNNALGIFITDDDAGIGLIGKDNFSSVATDLTYIQKIYGDRTFGGQPVNATIYSPGDDEHGDLTVWDTTTKTYISANVIPVGQAAGFMVVAFDTILFSNTTVDTIVTLPVGAFIWDIQVCVITTFDGSGTNLLDVGITGDGDRFVNDFDLEQAATTFYELSNLPYRMIATTSVTFKYDDNSDNATEGMDFIYVKYSIQPS